MNFRNISAWCDPQPGSADRPVHRPDCWPGLVAFMRMDVNNNPDIDFPAAIVIDQPARRRADRARDPDHPAGRSGGARRQRRRRDQLDGPRRQQHHLRPVRDRHADRPRRQRRARRDRPDPRRPARRHPRAAGRARSTSPASRSPISRPKRTDMTLEQLSWYRRQYGRQAAAGRRGHGRGRAATAASTARSASILDPAALQAQGITAAQVNQQLRQININAAGGRAEIAGSEQSVRVLGNARNAYRARRRPRSRSAAAARSGSPTSPGQRRLLAEQRTIAKMNGRQVVSFNDPAGQGLFRRHRL